MPQPRLQIPQWVAQIVDEFAHTHHWLKNTTVKCPSIVRVKKCHDLEINIPSSFASLVLPQQFRPTNDPMEQTRFFHAQARSKKRDATANGAPLLQHRERAPAPTLQ